MTIIRAPRPASGYVTFENKLVRDGTISRSAKMLLLEMLSHTDGWRTDSLSLANSGLEGRDAIRRMLRELEGLRYIRRVKHHIPKDTTDPDATPGGWEWNTYVFDQPASDEDLAALIKGPEPEPDDLTPDVDGDNIWAAQTANPQVKPWTPLPATANPATDQPAPDDQAIKERRTIDKKGGAVSGVPHQGRGQKEPPPKNSPEDSNHAPGQALRAEPGPGRDEFGPLSPRCRVHLNDNTNTACWKCRDTRIEFQEAQKARAKAAEEAKKAKALADRQQAREREGGNVPLPADFHATLEKEKARKAALTSELPSGQKGRELKPHPTVSVTAVRPLAGHAVRLTFSDGQEVDRDLFPVLIGPVFDKIRTDLAEFATATVDPELGVLCWPSGASIDAELLRYDDLWVQALAG